MAGEPDYGELRALAMQDAMAAAVQQCAVDGITDPVVIAQRIADARAAVAAGIP